MRTVLADISEMGVEWRQTLGPCSWETWAKAVARVFPDEPVSVYSQEGQGQ